MSGEPLRGFDRAMREYEAGEPDEAPVCKVCDSDLDRTYGGCRLCDEPEPEEEEPPAVFLGVVGSVGTLLLWLFLSAPQ